MPGIKSLQELFTKKLRDAYDAERQMSRSLPKMAKSASSEELRSAFEEHQQQTLGQIQRLEQVFQTLGDKARGTRCTGMAGIIEEGADVMSEGGADEVVDAALIGAAQKGEHYEIASYGTLVTFARTLGHEGAADLLQQTLDEEKEADRRLTELAESMVNQEAANQAEEDDEAGDDQDEGDEEDEQETVGTPAAGRSTKTTGARMRKVSGGSRAGGAAPGARSGAKSRPSARSGASSGGGSRGAAKKPSGGRGR